MTDGVHANVGAIQKMEEACGRFARSVLERLPDIHKELRQKTEALEERSNELRREISRLEDAISSADEDDDTSWEQNRLSDAEDELASVQRRRRKLADAAAAFAAQTRKVEDLSTGHTIKAQEFLRSAAGDLKSLLAASLDQASSDSAARPKSHNPADNVIRALAENPRLDFVAWSRMEHSSRLEILKEIELTVSVMHNRPPAHIKTKDFHKNGGRCRRGAYDEKSNTIYIGEFLLQQSQHPREVVRTLIHEGRHCYQCYAVKNPAAHPFPEEVKMWKHNLSPGNYVNPEKNFRQYYSQPIEQDAREYAERVVSKLYPL